MAVIQKFVFGQEQLDHFNELANDRAPIHSDRARAQSAGFDAPVVQGLALAARFSRLLGMYLPGERAILEKVELKYRAPVFVGQKLIYRCTVMQVLRPLSVSQIALGISADGIECVSGQCQCLVR